MAKEIDRAKVKQLMAEYDSQQEEVDAAKTALAEAKQKSSNIVRQVFVATGRKSIMHNGSNLTLRIRHKDKENPDPMTANYYFASSAEETLNLDDED